MNITFSHTPELQDIEQFLFNMQLTPADSFYQRMEYVPWKSENDAQRRYVRKQRMQWAGICAVILLLISFLFTPMGQALASEIYQFFIRASGNTLPLAPEERMEVVPTITPQPTYFPALLPADQVATIPPQPTEPPAGNDRNQAYQNLDSQTAKSLVDFELVMPSALPKEYRLTNIQYISELKAIRSTYASPSAGSGEFFSLTQGTNLAPFKIGADTPVEKLTINAHELEWVHGSWFTANGADESTWEPQAPLDTLRWEADGVSFELVFIMNEPSSPAYLSKEDMRFVAENLGSCAVLQGSEKYACEIQQAATAAGFIPWQFEQAPVGLSFNVIWYQPGVTAIWYGKGAGELGVLQSTQDFTALETSDWFSVPEDAIQQVNVGEQPAEYVNGGFVSQPGEDSAKWEQDSGQIRLRWKNGDWWFQIVKWGAPSMEPQELADLAATLVEDESLVNVGAQSESTQEEVNQAYLSIAEVEEMIGKSIKTPSIIPDGLPFSHVRQFSDDAVMVFYGDFAADKLRINGSILTFSQYPKFDDFNASMAERYVNYPPEVIHDVFVNGIPAKLVYGTYGIGFDENGNQTNFGTYTNDPFTVTLSWQDEENVYFLNFLAGSSSGARISDEDMIQIAESVK